LVNAQSNFLTNSSGTLYVELVEINNSLKEPIDKKIIKLNKGRGAGDIRGQLNFLGRD
jgi:hypothetical protein